MTENKRTTEQENQGKSTTTLLLLSRAPGLEKGLRVRAWICSIGIRWSVLNTT